MLRQHVSSRLCCSPGVVPPLVPRKSPPPSRRKHLTTGEDKGQEGGLGLRPGLPVPPLPEARARSLQGRVPPDPLPYRDMFPVVTWGPLPCPRVSLLPSSSMWNSTPILVPTSCSSHCSDRGVTFVVGTDMEGKGTYLHPRVSK